MPGNNAHRDTGYRLLDRDAGIHEREGRAASRSHRRRAVRFQHLGNEDNGVWELLFARQYRYERLFCERAVAYFAPAWAAHRTDFAYRIRREVIEVHVALLFVDFHGIHYHLVARSTERRDRERLGFSTGEEPGSVGTRQDPYSCRDRTDFGQRTPIRTGFPLENVRMYCLVRHLVGDDREQLGEILLIRILLGSVCGDTRVDFSHFGFHNLLRKKVERFREAELERYAPDIGFEFLGALEKSGNALLFSGFFPDFLDECGDFLDSLKTELEGFRHVFFCDFLRSGFDHVDLIFGSGQDEVERAVQTILGSRVEDEFAVQSADAHGADRAVPGDIRKRERCRSCDHRYEIRIVLAVIGEGRHHHLHFVPHAAVEERADGTVYGATRKDSVIRRTS